MNDFEDLLRIGFIAGSRGIVMSPNNEDKSRKRVYFSKSWALGSSIILELRSHNGEWKISRLETIGRYAFELAREKIITYEGKEAIDLVRRIGNGSN